MLPRTPRNEIQALEFDNGRTVIAIVRRDDGLLECFKDTLSYDCDEEHEYWSTAMMRDGGLFEDIDEVLKFYAP